GGEQHAAVHAPGIEQRDPRLRIVARRLASVGIAGAAGEQLRRLQMRAAETGENAAQHRLFADDQLFDAVAHLDADGAVAEFGFEIALPQIGRLHHMRIAVDDRHGQNPWNVAKLSTGSRSLTSVLTGWLSSA